MIHDADTCIPLFLQYKFIFAFSQQIGYFFIGFFKMMKKEAMALALTRAP